MELIYCDDYEEMSRKSADFLISELRKRPEQLFCAATGNSPLGVYGKLKTAKKDHPKLFGSLSILKLDEWAGLSMDDLSSCESFIQNEILNPLEIPSERYIAFQGDSHNPKKECERVQREITQRGPIDICILGLGKNGHFGFIEPADYFIPHAHLAPLTSTSQQHQMVGKLDKKPTFGLTLGMADILASKKIVLLITGNGKETVIREFLSGRISTKLPASFLWLHPNVHCYLDKSCL